MTQRKLTKRQVLNALLEAEEERKKISDAYKRLKRRENKFLDNHSELTRALYTILQKEYEKNGKDIEEELVPIVFKNHSFEPWTPSYAWERASCDIEVIDNVK